MSLRLEQEFADIRKRYGSLDNLTADEIAGLVDCCRRADNPFGDMNGSLVDAPVAVVRGQSFYPLTVGASIWLDEFVVKWWGNDDTCYFWALVYALVHAREKDAFTGLVEESAARWAILKTCLRFTFAKAELEKAVDLALGRAKSEPDRTHHPDESSKTDWFALVSRLEATSGIARDDWLWGRSAAYTVKAYHEMHAFAAANAGARSGCRAFDELDKAINALARLKKSIKERLAK